MVKLPRRIKDEILEYLHLEFGESKSDPDALKASDLKYEGRHIVKGVATHFWSYPSGVDRHWATVEELRDSYCLGTSTVGPDGRGVDRAKALNKVIVEFRPLSEKKEVMRMIRMSLKDGEASIPVRFPSGDKMEIDIEVADADSSPDVSISVTYENDRGLYIRCTSGVIVSYDTDFGYQCLVSVGTGPWRGD